MNDDPLLSAELLKRQRKAEFLHLCSLLFELLDLPPIGSPIPENPASTIGTKQAQRTIAKAKVARALRKVPL
jgi:hypothetical protein